MVLSPGRLFGIAKLTEVLDMATGGGDSTDSREGITMIETGSPASFFVIPRTEERDGYENECFTHYVQGMFHRWMSGRHRIFGPFPRTPSRRQRHRRMRIGCRLRADETRRTQAGLGRPPSADVPFRRSDDRDPRRPRRAAHSPDVLSEPCRQCGGKTVLGAWWADLVGCGKHGSGCVTHGHAVSCPVQHFQIVDAVTDG